MQVQTGKSKNSYAKSGKRKIFYKNGETKISVDELFAPSYEDVMAQIKKKVGERPELPRDLPKGEWTEQSIRVLKERYLVKDRSEEHTSELQSPCNLVCRLLLEKKKGRSSSTWFLSSVFHHWFFNDTATTEIYTLSLHDALPISTI